MADLITFINAVMSRSNELETTLSAVCGSGRLREHLLASAKERTSLSDVLCYRHPNGFTKMKLLSPGADSWSLRVHVWDRPVPPSDVHNHRWDFASCVVAGRLVETRFDLERGDGDTPVFRLSKDVAGTYHYTRDGVGRIRERGTVQHEPGQTYTLDHRVLHRADPDGGNLAVTVVLQGPDLTRTTTVVPAEVREHAGSRAITRLSGDEIADLMELVAGRLVV